MLSKLPLSIEIVTSTIKSLSSMSADSRRDAKNILSERYSDVRITDVTTCRDLDQVIARKPDLVFLGMKFIPNDIAGEPSEIWLNQALKSAGIPYTGSDEDASKLEHNKQFAKEQVAHCGLATASSQLIHTGESYTSDDIRLEYPIFIKPVDGGGGSGINELSLVHTFDELQRQVLWLSTVKNTDILLETYLPGREFSVGLLRRCGSNSFDALPLEIIAPKNQSGARFLSSRIKQDDAEQTLEVVDLALKSRLNELALDVFDALGSRDYGRIDIRLDAQGVPHFLEANLLPSLLNNYGNLPKASMMNIDLAHDKLILRIAELALPSYVSQSLLNELAIVPAAASLNFVG